MTQHNLYLLPSACVQERTRRITVLDFDLYERLLASAGKGTLQQKLEQQQTAAASLLLTTC